LSLGEGDNRDRVVRVPDIDKDDVSRRLGVLGQVGFGDSVTESDGGGVVDQSEGVQSGNLGSVVQGSSLDIGVPSGNGDNDVGNGLLELVLGDIPQLAEVGGGDLSEREGRRLSKVVDLETVSFRGTKEPVGPRQTLTPMLPFTSTSSALMNFFSNSAISGSFRDRPTSRFIEPTVFLKFDVSAVLAGSPICRWRGVKETRELWVSGPGAVVRA
jgi:hypothetical protein